LADTDNRFDGEINSADRFNDPLDDSLALVGWWPASILSGGPEDPEDTPEGWAPLVEKGTEQTHILDAIEDPVAETAAVRFREDRKEAEFEEKLDKLNESELSEGELAALAALDAALGEGADVEDALSIAIAAAENYLNPSSQNRDFQQRREGLADRNDRREDTIETATRPETDNTENLFSPPPSQSSIPNLETEIPEAAFGADPVFGFGFDFKVSQKVEPDKDSFTARRDTETVTNSDTSVAVTEEFGGITDAMDMIIGSSESDIISALAGNDHVYGDRPTNLDEAIHTDASPLTTPEFSSTGGDDTLSGNDGDDQVWGGAGSDILNGNDGADKLYGNAGGDNLFGYADDDVLVGGQGNDELTGGAGADEFQFAEGAGADNAARIEDLGTDVLQDFNIAEGDMFGLSDETFGFGDTGNLVDGDTYFETGVLNLNGTPVDISSGDTGPAIVAADQTGGTGVDLYYTEDPSQMTSANSYQIADAVGVSIADLDMHDFNLRS